MKLREGRNMKRGSRRMLLAAAGVMVVGLIGVALAASGTEISTRSSRASFSHANQNTGQGAFLPVCGSDAFVRPGRQAGPDESPRMSEEVFENVQVLTGIPVDEFMGTMGAFSAALSMCCSECHPGAGFGGADYSIESPRKRRARQMVQMMNAINRDNFGGRQVVTCWTCHRSMDRPPVTPIMEMMYGEPIYQMDDILRQSPRASSADEIFAKYIQALGGAERLANLTSFVARGTSVGYGYGPARQVEIFAQAPDQRTTIIHADEGDYTTTYDGRAGWLASPITPVPVMGLTRGELAGAKLDAEMSFPGRVTEVLNDWRVSTRDEIDGRLVQVVQGGTTGGEGFFATLYFDDESGLLTRLLRYADSAVGRIPTQIDYAEYREVAGIMMPFRWTFTWLGGRDVYELTEVTPNVPIDATSFARPVGAAR